MLNVNICLVRVCVEIIAHLMHCIMHCKFGI